MLRRGDGIRDRDRLGWVREFRGYEMMQGVGPDVDCAGGDGDVERCGLGDQGEEGADIGGGDGGGGDVVADVVRGGGD